MTKQPKDEACPLEGELEAPTKRSLYQASARHVARCHQGDLSGLSPMRDEQLDHAKGRSLVWVLSMLRAALETQSLERLEQRLEELAPSIAGRGHGFTNTNRPNRPTH